MGVRRRLPPARGEEGGRDVLGVAERRAQIGHGPPRVLVRPREQREGLLPELGGSPVLTGPCSRTPTAPQLQRLVARLRQRHRRLALDLRPRLLEHRHQREHVRGRRPLAGGRLALLQPFAIHQAVVRERHGIRERPVADSTSSAPSSAMLALVGNVLRCSAFAWFSARVYCSSLSKRSRPKRGSSSAICARSARSSGNTPSTSVTVPTTSRFRGASSSSETASISGRTAANAASVGRMGDRFRWILPFPLAFPRPARVHALLCCSCAARTRAHAPISAYRPLRG